MPRMREIVAGLKGGIAAPAGAMPNGNANGSGMAALLQQQEEMAKAGLADAQMGLLRRRAQVEEEELEARLSRARVDRARSERDGMTALVPQPVAQPNANGGGGAAWVERLVPELLRLYDGARTQQLALLERAGQANPQTDPMSAALQGLKALQELNAMVGTLAPVPQGLPAEAAIRLEQTKLEGQIRLRELEERGVERAERNRLSYMEFEDRRANRGFMEKQAETLLPAALQAFITRNDDTKSVPATAGAVPGQPVPEEATPTPAGQIQARCPRCGHVAALPPNAVSVTCARCQTMSMIARPRPDGTVGCPRCGSAIRVQPGQRGGPCPSCQVPLLLPGGGNQPVLGPNGLPASSVAQGTATGSTASASGRQSHNMSLPDF